MRGQPVSYQLVLHVEKSLTLQVGRLGTVRLPAGRYVYTGSARRGLEARIARHLRKDKPRRWHIDWLTTAPGISIVRVVRSTREECELNRATRGHAVIDGVGSSDCRAGCGAHLKAVPNPPHAASEPAST
jgi:Uri superfamily endonuclease